MVFLLHDIGEDVVVDAVYVVLVGEVAIFEEIANNLPTILTK